MLGRRAGQGSGEEGERGRWEEVGFWTVPRVRRQDSDTVDAGAHREAWLLRVPN